MMKKKEFLMYDKIYNKKVCGRMDLYDLTVILILFIIGLVIYDYIDTKLVLRKMRRQHENFMKKMDGYSKAFDKYVKTGDKNQLIEEFAALDEKYDDKGFRKRMKKKGSYAAVAGASASSTYLHSLHDTNDTTTNAKNNDDDILDLVQEHMEIHHRHVEETNRINELHEFERANELFNDQVSQDYDHFQDQADDFHDYHDSHDSHFDNHHY